MTETLEEMRHQAADHFEKMEWEQALELYGKIIEADPYDLDSLEQSSRILAIRGLPKFVAERYERLADIMLSRNDLDSARAYIQKIIGLFPENTDARLKMLKIIERQADAGEIISYKIKLARLFSELEESEKSVMVLNRACEQYPDNLELKMELAETYISHGMIDEGIGRYMELYGIFIRMDDRQKAMEALKRIRRIRPDDREILFPLGKLYMEMGLYDEAEGEFRGVLRTNLEDMEALICLGTVCEQKKQFRDAMLAYNKALTLNPGDQLARSKMEMLRMQMEEPAAQ
jgi:tetratricopeptide (TPR) repeat protein